jgi:hypothetical protein
METLQAIVRGLIHKRPQFHRFDQLLGRGQAGLDLAAIDG